MNLAPAVDPAEAAYVLDERVALMEEGRVPRLAWKRRLWLLRGAAALPLPEAPPATPDPRARLDKRSVARPLGKIASSVTPPGPTGAGQLALPTEPAQLDFEGAPLACAPPADVAARLEREAQPSTNQTELRFPLEPVQLELPWQDARRQRYALRDTLRPITPPRPAKCGRVRVVPTLEIVSVEGRAHFRGLMTCGSVWACPTCSAAIRAERAGEVQQLVQWHGQQRAYLLTLTVRHAFGENLRELRAGVSNAWRRFQQGAPWKRFRERVGFVGSVRALEVTHGAHGWHPHLHVLVLVDDAAELEAQREWLQLRWRAAVGRELGERNMPDLAHGCDLRPCRAVDYLAKLGLELASGEKSGRNGSRSPWQIAHDYSARGAPRDAVLWRAYCDGMQGARMLTWSRGLRAAAGLVDERTDEDVAADAGEAAALPRAHVCFIPGVAVWDRLRATPRVLVAVLEAAERGGADAVASVVRFALDRSSQHQEDPACRRLQQHPSSPRGSPSTGTSTSAITSPESPCTAGTASSSSRPTRIRRSASPAATSGTERTS